MSASALCSGVGDSGEVGGIGVVAGLAGVGGFVAARPFIFSKTP